MTDVWHPPPIRRLAVTGLGHNQPALVITGPERIRDSGFTELPITSQHAMTAGRLQPIHRDPFDRMLVARRSMRT